MAADDVVASAGGPRRMAAAAPRPHVARRRPGLATAGSPRSCSRFLCSSIFGVFSWWPIVSAVIMSFQKTNLADAPTWVGLDNFAAVLEDPLHAAGGPEHRLVRALALVFGYPVPLIARGSHERASPAQGSLLGARLPSGGRPAGGRRAALEVLLRPTPGGRLQHGARLVRARPVPVAQQRDVGDAVARPRGDLGRGRRHGHHLPGRARSASPPSSTTRPRSTVRPSCARSGT